VCVGGLLQTDPQERAKTTTASSGCRPRPTAPDPGAINTEPRPSWPLDPSPHDHTEPHSPTATVRKRPALTVTIVPLSFPQIKVKAEVREVAGSARLPCTACVIHCRAYTRVSHQASGLLWPHLPALMPRFTLQPVIRIVWTLSFFWSKFMIDSVRDEGLSRCSLPPADERFTFGTKRSAGNSKPLVFAIRTQNFAPAHLTRHTANPSRLGLRWPLHTVALPSGSLSGLTRNGAS